MVGDAASTPAPRIRVAHLIESLGIGGAERRLVSDLRWLDRQHYEHRVIYLTAADALRAEIESGGVPTVGLKMRHLRDWRTGVFRLARLLREWRPQLLHTQVFGADVYGRLAAALARVPIVVSTVQTIPYTQQLHRFFSRKRVAADRLTARLFTHQFVAVSEPVRDALMAEFGIPPSRIRVIPNGVDVTRFSPRTPERMAHARAALGLDHAAFVIVAVGRLIPEKDHATLLRAFRTVGGQLPQARLVVAGDGPLRNQLERLARELGLEGQANFLGMRSDVDRLFHAADLFVLPSIREGLPVALLEAMASEVPVIASALSQHLGIVEAGRTGWLVPAGASERLADAILAVAGDPSDAHEVARRGRAHVVAHFSAEALACQLQRLYDELCVRSLPERGLTAARNSAKVRVHSV